MALNGAGWQADFEAWLAPFLAHLAHRARRSMGPLYGAGLIGPGDRKSVQPMAERLGLGTHDRLHQFVSSAAWDAAPHEAELLAQLDRVGAAGVRFAVVLADAGAWRTVRRCACTGATTSTCPARRSGLSASDASQASANTICPTCRPTRRSSGWQRRSRRDGFASRRISS